MFGVPGDFAFPVQDAVVNDPDIEWIGCSNELNAVTPPTAAGGDTALPRGRSMGRGDGKHLWWCHSREPPTPPRGELVPSRWGATVYQKR